MEVNTVADCFLNKGLIDATGRAGESSGLLRKWHDVKLKAAIFERDQVR
jgi:hypothetical protein